MVNWSKAKITDWKIAEQLVYGIIWMIVILLPLIFLDFNDIHQQKRIVRGWIRILPFFLIFLPHLLNNNRRSLYLISTLLVILVINYLFILNADFQNFIVDLFNGNGRGRMEDSGIRKHFRDPGDWHPGKKHFHKLAGARYWLFTSNVFVSILVVGFNATLYYTSRWLKEEQKRKDIEKQNVQSQLSQLQQQVSPHFFMNTLNNIHALIDYDKEDAKDAVLRLSELMRYVLYDLSEGKTTLQKEVNFLKSYIDLMKLRISESLDLLVKFPDEIPEITLPPFIFIPFVENTFKHGIGLTGDSYIHLLMEVYDGKIHFRLQNSIPSTRPENEMYSGIGIENTRKRLDLLFKGKHSLQIIKRENEFEVDLVFPYETLMH